ncbi:hypothetical protein [Cereibacter changlensis]|uniref:hypothetical protein n=1 Tax=Cereibacter changlensis TaxID=402884 RepID=UPI0014756338|nr:hypothetical protein [Cereibacter changlensis]
MNWDEIEQKWREMARRLHSQPANLSPSMGFLGLVDAVTTGPAEPAATPSAVLPAE